jgi:hypothetical protein
MESDAVQMSPKLSLYNEILDRLHDLADSSNPVGECPHHEPGCVSQVRPGGSCFLMPSDCVANIVNLIIIASLWVCKEPDEAHLLWQ